MYISVLHVLGILAALGLLTGVSVLSGRKVKNASDFTSGGGKAGTLVTTGVIMGTLVGGSATVGTAQLAFTNGLSAWWFTLGGGIGCVIFALLYVVPLRRGGGLTITGILAAEFGGAVDMWSSLLSSTGLFINILSQLLSASALLAIIFPQMNFASAVFISAALMAVYVVFGGILSAGSAGLVKVVLLCTAAVSAGAIVLGSGGGFSALWTGLDRETYFNLFSRGVGTDGGAALSLILGVLSTQTYAQAVMSSRGDKNARIAALISAAVMPFIGAGGVLVGLFMRVNHPELSAARLAFPYFILEYMPDLLGGIVIGALLVAILGTGGGLTLGITTVIDREIVKRLTRRLDDPAKELIFSRICIAVILAGAAGLTLCPIGDTILNFAFMSMALRAAVVFMPLTCALFFPGRVDRRFALAAVILSPVCVLAGELFLDLKFDPLFPGVGIAAVLCIVGAAVSARRKHS